MAVTKSSARLNTENVSLHTTDDAIGGLLITLKEVVTKLNLLRARFLG